jgi:predicted ribosomally synthesized peptide with SipW-like signal peptide
MTTQTKKKVRVGSLAAVIAGVMVTGGIMAYFSDGDTATNSFTIGKVSLDLVEPNWDETKAEDILPNQEIAKDPQIVNDGVNDEYVFMEVQVPYMTVQLENADGSTSSYVDVELFSYNVNTGWTEIEEIATDTGNGSTADNAATVDGRKTYKSTGAVASADNEITVGTKHLLGSKEITVKDDTTGLTQKQTIYYGYVTHLYAYGTADAMTPLKSQDGTKNALETDVTGDSTTTPLFNFVRFANIQENSQEVSGDENDLQATTTQGAVSSDIDYSTGDETAAGAGIIDVDNDTDATKKTYSYMNILEEMNLDININAYGIQTTNLNDTASTGDSVTNNDGKVAAADVWAVLAASRPSTEQAANVKEADNTDEKTA